MALARRALPLAIVAVCALLLAVGVVGTREPVGDHGSPQAVVAAAASVATGVVHEPSTSITKQTSPLVLIATVGTVAARRGRQRVRPAGRHGRGEGAGPDRRRREPGSRLRPERSARLDEGLARLAVELDVLVGHLRY